MRTKTIKKREKQHFRQVAEKKYQLQKKGAKLSQSYENRAIYKEKPQRQINLGGNCAFSQQHDPGVDGP